MNWIAEVKNKLDIVDFIRNDGIELKAESGGRWSARCPFHNEKTPSFKISETFQNYKCFGCGETGDVISFYAKRNVLDYYTAATMLAEQLGIKIKKIDNSETEKIQRFLRILSTLDEFYKIKFQELSEHHPAKKQITNRGLNITEDFGYAPSSNNETLDFLLKENKFDKEDLLELGIISDKNNIQLKDRLIFSIRNYMGKTIGFSGRALINTDSYKYVNSKSSIVYDKQNTLYNIEYAKDTARKLKYIFVVEGQFDVIAMKQKGYENTVAVSGSAMTEKHIKEIQRCIGDEGKIILLLDGDNAGKNAMLKVFHNFPNIHKYLYVILLPDKQDPCEYLQNNDKLSHIKESMLSIIYQEIKSRHDMSKIADRQVFLDEVQEELTKYIKDKQIKEQYLRSACVSAGIKFDTIKIKSIKTKEKKKTELTKNASFFDKLEKIDKYYLASIACYIANKKLLKTKLDETLYPNKYIDIIIEINKDENDKFIPECYKKQKLAKVIADLQMDKFDDSILAESHYNMLIKQAEDIKKRNDKKEQTLNLLNNIEGLEPDKVLNILRTLENSD